MFCFVFILNMHLIHYEFDWFEINAADLHFLRCFICDEGESFSSKGRQETLINAQTNAFENKHKYVHMTVITFN